jgi:transcriptional regulator with XRE-family HTH domain
MKKTGKYLKAARTLKGLTQLELADRTGLTDNTISRIENGSQNPTFETVKKIAKALDLNLSDIPT